jgi:hypothetical protein
MWNKLKMISRGKLQKLKYFRIRTFHENGAQQNQMKQLALFRFLRNLILVAKSTFFWKKIAIWKNTG